jgi:hypothetical protein
LLALQLHSSWSSFTLSIKPRSWGEVLGSSTRLLPALAWSWRLREGLVNMANKEFENVQAALFGSACMTCSSRVVSRCFMFQPSIRAGAAAQNTTTTPHKT